MFDENTSVEEINCNKADLSLDRSQENFETETNITISTENISTILVMIITIYNPLMFNQRKFSKRLLR